MFIAFEVFVIIVGILGLFQMESHSNVVHLVRRKIPCQFDEVDFANCLAEFATVWKDLVEYSSLLLKKNANTRVKWDAVPHLSRVVRTNERLVRTPPSVWRKTMAIR